MKYITLTRGDSQIWYPMYEIKPEYIGNGLSWNPFTSQNGSVTGATSGGNIPGTIQVSFDNIFNDSFPIHASDFGSIIQTEDLFETDPDRGGNWLKRASGDYIEIPIGEKPDDWDTNYFDYCTIAQENYYQIWNYLVPIGGSNIDIPPTWNSSAQYYKNNTSDVRQRFNHLFKTGAGFTFGIWTGTGTGYQGYNKHYSRLGTNPGSTQFNIADKVYWRNRNGDTIDFTGLVHDAVVWYSALTIMDLSPYGESGYSTNLLTNESRTYYIFVYVTYQDTTYYGIANIGLNSSGAPVNARMILFDENLWGADSISDEEPEKSEYEVEEGPVTPSRSGGQGTFTSMSNNDGDRSGTSLLSAISTANTTFKTVLGDAFNIYEVGASDLSKVINVLYGSSYFTRFENMMFNPLSAIISCALLPEIFVTSPAPLHDMLAGGYNISQHIWPNPVQFKSPEPLIVRHIGDISLNKYFDGYADFDPYTKAKLHLPYIGEISIDINKIAHGEIAVDYVCDVLSGNVAAWVWCNDIDGNHQYCYTATGNCAYNIPLFSATADGSAIGKIIGGVASISVGNILGGAMSVADGAAGVASRHTQITGTYSGNIGQVTNPKCFLEISRPQWVNVDDENDKPYKRGEGLPAVMKGTIASNNLKNHVSVSWVDLTNIVAATPEELAEIESLLKSGILIKE